MGKRLIFGKNKKKKDVEITGLDVENGSSDSASNSSKNSSKKENKSKTANKAAKPAKKEDKKLVNNKKMRTKNNGSLKRIKKRHIVRDMLKKLPKEEEEEEEVIDEDKTEEEIYQSRKLMIRQIQGMIAKKAHEGDNVSEYDSWTDLEENFAKAYEPIPLNIEMDAWKKMSKSDILKAVKSQKMRKDFEYMSRSEILIQIDRMKRSAKYLSTKFGVHNLVHPQMHNHPPLDSLMTMASMTNYEDHESVVSNFSTNVPDYVSRSEILKVYEMDTKRTTVKYEKRLAKTTREVEKPAKPRREHGSWSSRASSIMNNPESVYISREEVLRNLQRSSKKKIHDSWSSRASSILARCQENAEEPVYVSRAELVGKLKNTALNEDSGSSSSMSDDDDLDGTESEASTVKNVKLKSHTNINGPDSGQTRTVAAMIHNENEANDEDASSICSCSSCESYTDCSCCYDYGSKQAGSVSSNTSEAETIVDAGEREAEKALSEKSGRDKLKRKDMYVVNDVSEQSKSKKDLVPKSKVKQVQLIAKKEAQVEDEPPPIISSKERRNDKKILPNLAVRRQQFQNKINNFEKMYEPVDAHEIRRQRNKKALKQHLKELANVWEDTIDDLNTLRRGQVLKELRRYLKEIVDLDNGTPEDIHNQVEVALREALDSNFEALSNVNIGQVYVPMEDHTTNKTVSRDTTDYDTFGSIDSLIFEPKIRPKVEDIKEAQEEIEHQFEYLDNHLQNPKKKTLVGPGKTTFAERVRLFQNLESKKPKPPPPLQRPTRKITFLDVVGHETSWKEVAESKSKEGEKSKVQFADCTESSCGHNTSMKEFSSFMNESSFCDCCTQCREEGVDRSQDISLSERPQTNGLTDPSCTFSSDAISWAFLSSSQKKEVAKEPEKQEPPPLTVGNLRRQLKEAFGAPAATVATAVATQKDSIEYQQEETLVYNSSEVELNVDFLTEYAQRKDLFDSLGSDTNPILMSRGDGKSIVLTEDKFRTGLTDSLKKASTVVRRSSSLKKGSSEMGDSGICSPPPAVVCEKITENSEENTYENDDSDSGMGTNQKSLHSALMKSVLNASITSKNSRESSSSKRQEKKQPDTMIRELKSKLKQKFPTQGTINARASSSEGSVASRGSNKSQQGLQEIYESSMYEECSEEPVVTNANGLADIAMPDLSNKNAKETREILYGPGGVFGPKGPFSTPLVRYPGGLEVSPSPTGSKMRTPTNQALNSELSSVAEDRSCKSQTVMNSVRQFGVTPTSGTDQNSSKPPSRMDQYRADPSPSGGPEKSHFWKEDKRQRMMAWINNNNGNILPLVGSFFSSDFVWWKVKTLVNGSAC